LRCLATAVLTLLLAVTVTGESPSASRDPAFRVIVHNDVRGTQISRTLVSSIFLREALRWGDGLRIQPVDQSLRSPVRAEFSEAVLEKSIDGVQLLWTRKLAKGVIPPVVKSSDEEVIAYIARTEGAIGYVSPTVPLPPTVKALDIIE
jgi:ABC-type phosphate transport system substrate-binding protein